MKRITFLLILSFLASVHIGWAQDDEKEDETKKVADAVKDHQAFDGLFPMYQDTKTGSLKMVIDEDQIGKEFIYFYYIENGPTEAFAFRGQFRGSRIIKIEKYFDKIEFVLQNTSSYFDPENALSRAQDANISRAILFSGKVEAGSEEEGKYLISADGIFLKEALGMVKFPSFSKDPNAFKLGSLSKDKSKYNAIKNYPKNTDLVVEYVYENSLPKNFGSRAVTDARNISILVQHSLIEVPDNDYKVRYDDPRVGYFMTQVTDMTTPHPAPYRDRIHRWHLKKKDPNAAMSEPVTPITWWIENTTPVEWRETIKDGVLAWNEAFEAAGFKNAMVVKVQPDDADWDAGDIRYNVLRWTSSPNPPFGGYGPSFVNPRTGQILGADIMLEYVFMTNRVRYDRLFSTAENEYENLPLDASKYCMFDQMMQQNLILGNTALSIAGATAIELEGMLKEGLKDLIMHEVGHTLGLNHNMKSSQAVTVDQLYDQEFAVGNSLTGSVMDYAPINLRPDLDMKGGYYSNKVGPYDVWAIEAGYKPTDEAGLNAILARSTEPQLTFGNDADDMRSPGRHLDPRINTGDLAKDQIRYSRDRMELISGLYGDLMDKFKDEGDSYQGMLFGFYSMYYNYIGAGNVISRYIGGLYVDRAMIGQDGGNQPFEPVPAKKQKEAMDALAKYMFAPDAFEMPSKLFPYLARQRRGFNHYGSQEDPHMHDLILGSQKRVLDHLLHPNTLERISDTELYGNKYSLSSMMTDLNDAIFEADAGKNVNSYRQNLQLEYTKRLIKVMSGDAYTNMAKSMALYNIKNIRSMASSTGGDTATKAHRQHLMLLIDKALKAG